MSRGLLFHQLHFQNLLFLVILACTGILPTLASLILLDSNSTKPNAIWCCYGFIHLLISMCIIQYRLENTIKVKNERTIAKQTTLDT